MQKWKLTMNCDYNCFSVGKEMWKKPHTDEEINKKCTKARETKRKPAPEQHPNEETKSHQAPHALEIDEHHVQSWRQKPFICKWRKGKSFFYWAQNEQKLLT